MEKTNTPKEVSQLADLIAAKTGLSRRDVLRGILASVLLGSSLWGCENTNPEREGAEFLPDANNTPLDHSGVPEFSPDTPSYPTSVEGYRGLAALPFFELTKEGKLRLTIKDMPPAIDFHTHLAFCVGNKPRVDLLKAAPDTRYLIDCDGTDPVCRYDMNEYINKIATEEMLKNMPAETVSCMIGKQGEGAAYTHTLPNLTEELDLMQFERAVLHPIAIKLLKPDNMTEHWSDALQRSTVSDRYISFCSVHPLADDPIAQLQGYHRLGYRGLKIHPTMQNIEPDHPKTLSVFQECDRLKIMVFFHAGRAGIEQENSRKYAEMKHYIQPVKDFPNTTFVFGHSGCRDWREALDIAKQNKNVWLDLHGQGLNQLKVILDEFDHDRLLFGSDWPFYPIAATLAKILIACDGNKTLRNKILAENAKRLLQTYIDKP